MLKLQFKDQRQPAVWLVESVTSIGSGTKNQIVINESGIEEVHARISKQGDALYLSDNGTFSGTFVNGNKISQNFQLRPGDRIRVGKVELEIVDPKSGGEKPVAAAVAPRADWSIMAISGELKGKSIPVRGSLVFGRSASCDIVINDAHMSRRHAEISLKDGVLRIVDLKSSNGTCVNGKNIGEQQLKPGDRIGFDQITFLVAGPANASVEAEGSDDPDDVTVFRAAAIPRKPPQPAAKPAPVTPAPSAAAEARVSAAPTGSKLPLIIIGAVVLVILAGVAGFVLSS